METKVTKATLSMLVALMQLLALVPFSECGTLDRFCGGAASADGILATNGTVRFANLSVPVRSIGLNGTLSLSPLPAGGGYPLAPSLVVGGGGPSWAYRGTGYGAFGRQTVFSDGNLSAELDFAAPGNSSLLVQLPKNATVQEASLGIEGLCGQRWWNSSWRNRIALNIADFSGQDQTDFAAEVLLDTRNWTVGSALREFRVAAVDPASGNETEVPLQVLDEVNNGTRCLEAALVFAVSGLKANSTRMFNLYFNNPQATERSPLYRDFKPRLVRNRLLGVEREDSFFGPFECIKGAAFDSSGNYWAVDATRNCVIGYTGVLGTQGVAGADARHLSFPTDVAVTPAGRIAVADQSNYRVQVFEPNGSLAFTLGETGVPGGDNAHFLAPYGIATDADGWLYVTDGGTQRIQVFDSNGSYLATLGGSQGSGNNQFFCLGGLSVTPSKDIYVADGGNYRVQAFRHTSGTTWLYNFTLGVTGVEGIDNSHFVFPGDVFVDSGGRIFVVDELGYRVQIFSGTTYQSTLGVSGIGGVDNVHFNHPMSVAISPGGLIHITDFGPTGSCRVQVYDSSLKYVQSLGERHWTNQVMAGPSNSQLDGPCGVTANSTGCIFVSDTNNHRVQVLDPFGGYVRTLGVTGSSGADVGHFLFPRGIDISGSGKLLVADGGNVTPVQIFSNHRVLVFNDLNDNLADYQLGLTGAIGNDNTHLNLPFDVATNGAGRIAVADTGFPDSITPGLYYGQRAQLFNDLSDSVADGTYGTTGAPGCDTTHVRYPRGVGMSSSGTTYVADTDNNRLVAFWSDGNQVADLVLNPSGAAGSGPGQFRAPRDVDVDSRGRIIVSDTGNNRIQLLADNGQPLLDIGNASVSNSDGFHFRGPVGVDVGFDGKFYVADAGNHRIVRIVQANLSIGAAETIDAPVDVALDLGADGSVEWSAPGVLVGNATAPGLAGSLNNALATLSSGPDTWGNILAMVPLNLSNAGRGRLRLANLTIVYDVSCEPRNLVQSVWSYVTAHASEADACGNVTVPIVFSAESAGGIRLSDLNLTGDFAPTLLSPIPEMELDEDCCAPALYDLSAHFKDDFDPSLNYSIQLLTNATVADVRLVNGSLLSVDCTIFSARNWSGSIGLRASAADSRGLNTTSNQFNITVRPVNDAPVITSTPSLNATVGAPWSYNVRATDAENSTLLFTLQKCPNAMSINSTGFVNWTPAATQEGANDVVVRVSDGSLPAEQAFTVTATRPAHPPRVLSTPVTVAQVGKRYTYAIEARDDNNDTLAYALLKAPAGMSIGNATGVIEWTPSEAQRGTHEVLATVSDPFVAVQHGFNITVSNVSDVLPSISFTQPLPNTKVTGKTWLRGTASARVGSVESVELSLDGTTWSAASGKASWAFQLDTSKYPNGIHKIYARVKDTSGNYAQTNLTLDFGNGATKPSEPGLLGNTTFLIGLILIIALAAAGAGAYLVMRKKRAAGGGAKAHGSAEASTATATSDVQGAASSKASPTPAPKPKLAAKPQAPPPKPVDSAFLVYHDGRLITYYSRSESMKLDATLDMIRKFVKASFTGQLGRLDSMRYENMNVIMERGIQMYMVVITPLEAFDDLRRDMRHLLNEVHEKYKATFKVWDGEFSGVKGAKQMVERFAGEDVWEELEEPKPKAPPANEQEPPAKSTLKGEPPSSTEPEEASKKPPMKGAPPPEPEDAGAPKLAAKGAPPAKPEMDESPFKVPPPKTHDAGAWRPEEPPKMSPPESESSEPAASPNKEPSESNQKGPTPSSAGGDPGDKVRLLEEKFLKGDISEALYRELKEKYTKK